MSDPIGQQGRWLEILEEFTFTVQHRSGNKHRNADAMSRRPCQQCHRTDNEEGIAELQVNALSNDDGFFFEMNLWNSEQLSKGQREDVELREFYNLKLKYPEEKPAWDELLPTAETTKILWNQWDNIIMQDRVLYRKTISVQEHEPVVKQLIIPRNLRIQLMKLAHEGMTGGHLGFEKTKVQVQRRAYWPGFSKDVFRFCQDCESCYRYRRGAAPKQGLLEPLVVGDVMERLIIDITGPHPNSATVINIC